MTAVALDWPAGAFAALGEPSRLRIVEFLRLGPRTVNDVAEHLGIRQPQVSKHLKALGLAGLVSSRAVARHRVYALEQQPFAGIAVWVGSFDALWETRMDSLGAYLAALGYADATDTYSLLPPAGGAVLPKGTVQS